MQTKFDREINRLEKKMSYTEKSLKDIEKEQKRISQYFNWRRLPQAFRGKDVAQHAIGSVIILLPLFLNQESFQLATGLAWWQLITHLVLTFMASILILYFAKYHEVKREKFLGIPIRIYSLIALGVLMTGLFMFIYYLPAFYALGQDNPEGRAFVWFLGFSFIGGASADIIK